MRSEMSGGAGEGPGLAAYCLLAMVEAGRSAGNVDQTISFLEGSIDSGFGGSSYVAAISAHALTRACAKIGKGCDLATRARAKLLEMATRMLTAQNTGVHPAQWSLLLLQMLVLFPTAPRLVLRWRRLRMPCSLWWVLATPRAPIPVRDGCS